MGYQSPSLKDYLRMPFSPVNYLPLLSSLISQLKFSPVGVGPNQSSPIASRVFFSSVFLQSCHWYIHLFFSLPHFLYLLHLSIALFGQPDWSKTSPPRISRSRPAMWMLWQLFEVVSHSESAWPLLTAIATSRPAGHMSRKQLLLSHFISLTTNVLRFLLGDPIPLHY